MKVTESCVVIRPAPSGLDTLTQLKEGQRIMAKIASVSREKVLLEIAGNTIEARNEGTSVTPGSVFLFTVKLAENGRIELKILANLSETGQNPDQSSQDANQILMGALKEEGLPSTPTNLQTLNRILSEIQLKLNILPLPKTAAFLMARNMPVTLENCIIAWVQTDRQLRDYWWNQLERAGWLDPQQIMQFSKDADHIFKWLSKNARQSVREQSQAGQQISETESFREKVILDQASDDADQPKAGKPARDSARWNKITELLTRRPSEGPGQENIRTNQDSSRNGLFLVRDTQSRIHELVIEPDRKRDNREYGIPGQTLRLLIPTENLGEIEVLLSQNTQSPRIHFKVESDGVKEFLWREIGRLQEIIGSKIQIGIETLPHRTENGGMDLWM